MTEGRFNSSTNGHLLQPHTSKRMIAMDHTIAGAASGETVRYYGAEGFTISGKRTEE